MASDVFDSLVTSPLEVLCSKPVLPWEMNQVSEGDWQRKGCFFNGASAEMTPLACVSGFISRGMASVPWSRHGFCFSFQKIAFGFQSMLFSISTGKELLWDRARG